LGHQQIYGDQPVSMTDFQDFLKRQCAHVAIGEFKPGKFAEAQKLYEDAVATYHDGFEHAYLLQEPGTNRGISVILWRSVEDFNEGQSEAAHQEIMKKMAPLFTQLPTTSVYEVVSDIDSAHSEATMA
jgi:heme-degrading monooxygenase HmoA